MDRPLGYTDPALADLDAIYRWLTQTGAGQRAKRRFLRLVTAIERLGEQPCLYAIGGYDGAREMTVERHRVIYTVTPDTGLSETSGDVLVLRVFGPGQSRVGS